MFLIILQNLYSFTFGPQHPAAHGVLCCLLYFIGEFIMLIDINIGFLHSGVENLTEYNTLEQNMPYFDSLDYVSVVCNEHLLSLAFENLLSCCIAISTSYISMIMVEFTSCFNGLLSVSCMLMDIGALSPLLWSFEERDNICLFYDMLTGTRMHIAFMVLLGVLDDFAYGFVDFLYACLTSCMFLLDIYEFLVVHNSIFYISLRGLSVLDLYDLVFLSVSGVLARSLGIVWDCSLYSTYELYFLISYDYGYSFTGDAFDRFLLRLFDMSMALVIVNQLFFNVFFIFGFVSLFDYLYVDINIETLIMLFYSVWCATLPGITFANCEHPNGEYILYIILNFCSCTSLSISTADFIHLLILDIFISGFMLHDLVAIIGNMDVVFGSVDS